MAAGGLRSAKSISRETYATHQLQVLLSYPLDLGHDILVLPQDPFLDSPLVSFLQRANEMGSASRLFVQRDGTHSTSYVQVRLIAYGGLEHVPVLLDEVVVYASSPSTRRIVDRESLPVARHQLPFGPDCCC